MCGIAGVVHRVGPVAPDPTPRLLASLAHRGPDGEGVWRSPGQDAVLVHRRLAIIDPSPAGAQPMVTPDRQHVIVFNGEIYNYRELREALEGRGQRFSTKSDTEVLLRLVACDGPQALARVRGMFAFACWDVRAQSLLLARDRFGIKPVYVAVTNDSIAFASEIQSLVATGLVPGAIDPAGVLSYLAWGSILPPLTWVADVESLPPGSWLRWCRNAGVQRGRFANVAD